MSWAFIKITLIPFLIFYGFVYSLRVLVSNFEIRKMKRFILLKGHVIRIHSDACCGAFLRWTGPGKMAGSQSTVLDKGERLIRHDLSHLMTKPAKWHVRPVKTQLNLGIRSVWSESSLSAWRKLRSLATHWVHSEDYDQTGRRPRLIWVFAGRTYHFVGFVMRQLICVYFAMAWWLVWDYNRETFWLYWTC